MARWYLKLGFGFEDPDRILQGNYDLNILSHSTICIVFFNLEHVEGAITNMLMNTIGLIKKLWVTGKRELKNKNL